jgi:L,D-peptidoglycan transpeptidase YkuD (ErfK/YbiS/YcfS/YnhG family)
LKLWSLSFLLNWRESLKKHRAWARKSISFLLVVLPLGLLPDISWEVVAGQRLSLNAIPWEVQSDVPSVPPASEAKDAESLLREAYRLLSNGQRAEALSIAQELVLRYPNFQLGQLLFADLMNLISDQPMDVRSALHEGASDVASKLQQLNAEARLRLNRPGPAAYAGKEPAGLAYLSTKVPFVIVVDALHSRLYVMTHAASAGTQESSKGLQVVFESYMSVGQRGIGKQQKGDGKTPLGVYVIQKTYPGHVLPDLYGSGALTLNYPNDLDILDGKTGSGIWIHGSPSEQYARAPEATDGCVVLSNPDMLTLMKLHFPAGTPVFILPKVEWVEPHKNKNLRSRLWPTEKVQDEKNRREILAMLSWQGEGRNMMSILYAAETLISGQASVMVTPSYWVEQGHQWKAIPANSGERQLADRSSPVARPSGRAVVR